MSFFDEFGNEWVPAPSGGGCMIAILIIFSAIFVVPYIIYSDHIDARKAEEMSRTPGFHHFVGPSYSSPYRLSVDDEWKLPQSNSNNSELSAAITRGEAFLYQVSNGYDDRWKWVNGDHVQNAQSIREVLIYMFSHCPNETDLYDTIDVTVEFHNNESIPNYYTLYGTKPYPEKHKIATGQILAIYTDISPKGDYITAIVVTSTIIIHVYN